MSARAAELLKGIDYASVVLVSLAFDAAEVNHPMAGSGYLVPAVEGHTITACSWASSKWAHVGSSETVVMRVSAGRYGDDRALSLNDDALLEAVRGRLGCDHGARRRAPHRAHQPLGAVAAPSSGPAIWSWWPTSNKRWPRMLPGCR